MASCNTLCSLLQGHVRGYQYAYTLDEILAFLGVLPEPAATIFATAAFAGLRRGEIRGLRWEDYHDGEIQVAQSVWESHVSTPKTNQSSGAVPVIRPLARMLEAHRMRYGNPSAGPIFAAVNGKPLSLNNVVGRMILPVLNRCEVCGVSKAKHLGVEHKCATNRFPSGMAGTRREE